MRILFCNYEYPPLGGGGGVINALLAAEMAKRHEVTVLTSRGNGLPSLTVESGVRVIRVPVFFRRREAVANVPSMLAFIPVAIREGKKLLAAERFDVINTHFVLPTGPVGNALAHFSGVPNVLTVHGGDLYDPSKFISPHRHLLLRLWIRHLLRNSAAVVGQSRNTLHNMRRYYAPELEGIRIPLGIRRPIIDAVPRKRYGFRPGQILLVTVGRLVPRKAVGQLVALMNALDDPAVHLLIIGTGPQEGALKSEVAARRLQARVHFLGHVDEAEKFRLLAISDVYVSTSQHEGFGLVFLEAMACGLPVVCYDCGGQTDFLRDGQTGYLVPLNDQARFTDRCRSLIASSPARAVMGENNGRRVQDFFIDRCAARYESTFADLLEAKANAVRPRLAVSGTA